MSVDRSFVERNTVQRRRLEELVTTLSEEDLARPLGAGWTVTTALGHLAFWDRRLLALLEVWEREGVKPAPDYDPPEGEGTVLDAPDVAPGTAIQLALESAEAIDQKVASLPDDMIAEILRLPDPPSLERGLHRGDHIDQIAHALGRQV
jgi:hypothetical protein